ncbi:MAG: coproporphyrinogen-III oxidase family protein [bacterium]
MTATTQRAEPATARLDLKETEVGSVFVSNYPPYSFWRDETVEAGLQALNSAPVAGNTLGLYLHIPFCRKRCKFCYFRVYTDKNSAQVEQYVEALAREVEIYGALPAVAGRPLQFVYFGGGTPSYISVKHLEKLAADLKASLPWDTAEEVTFECEPGTLSQTKLEAIRGIGVTRLSLGIENFNDVILQQNGRAHLSGEIFRAMPWIEALGFDQLNIDLIAGMVGETWETWKDNVQKTIDVNPDSVTIYQMELPFNTVYTKMMTEEGRELPIADWQTKRDWHQYAFDELAAAGYEISSAYTMVKKSKPCRFVYRDSVWHGTDMLGTGVASFGHMSGVHMQNAASWDDYLDRLAQGRLPLQRALVTTSEERLVRELILQLKLGKVSVRYFENKFKVNIIEAFAPAYKTLRQEGMLTFDEQEVRLTTNGLLRVDQLLPEFYAERYRNARYT